MTAAVCTVVVIKISFMGRDTWTEILAPSLLDAQLPLCYPMSLSFSCLTCILGIISLSSHGGCKIYLRICKHLAQWTISTQHIVTTIVILETKAVEMNIPGHIIA